MVTEEEDCIVETYVGKMLQVLITLHNFRYLLGISLEKQISIQDLVLKNEEKFF